MTNRTVLATFTVVSLSLFLAPAIHAAPPEKEKPADPGKAADEKKADEESVRAVLEAHNRERAEAKLAPLTLESRLTAAAKVHADDMASHQKMTHDGSDGSSPSDRIKRQGYHYQSDAENVAEGYRSVDALMHGWMTSEHHRENILGKYSEVGIAVARDDDGTPYWCVDFATPWKRLDPAVAADDLLKALNKERSAAKLTPLKVRGELSKAASQIASHFAAADTFQPKDRGEDVVTILKRLGYRFRSLAELAASGKQGGPEVVKTWMDNPSNREYVVGAFTEVGIGYANSPTGIPFWCLVLARPVKE